ncbi:MAG: TonB-dependent receptor [Spongiibacteraceae bacterium]
MMNSLKLILAAALFAQAALVSAAASRPQDLTDLSLEELMNIEVISTPQFAGRIADLPASVSILTANDIRVYGWRTLADVLRSLRGFNVTYDRTYSYAGVRGLSPAGDPKPRLNILIDGISTVENIYGSVLLGGEFPLDVDLIERIEVVRGPSASVVGGDSMGGVINIITRRGAALRGSEIAASAGTGEAYSGRTSVGGVTANGIEYLLSANAYNAEGETLKFPDLAPANADISTHNDEERRRQLFAKFSYGAWHAEIIHGKREKTVATGSYGTVFDDPSHREDDTETLAEIGHKLWFDNTTTLSTRIYSGQYAYDGIFPYIYDDLNYYHNRDRARGKWWGSELRVQSNRWSGHQLMAGIEFIDYYQQDQRNDDIGFGCIGYSDSPCLDDEHNGEKLSVYGQDEIALTDKTRLTLGARLDHTENNEARWSPRVGLVQHTAQAGTFKLLYATAYREASAFEKYYSLAEVPSGNPDLDDEFIRSLEGIWEYAIDARSQFSASVYRYTAKNIIAADNDGMNRNLSTITGRGFEVEFNRSLANRTSVRTSYSLQYPELAGERPANAPQHLFKLNANTPIANTAWSSGLEVQATSKRRTEIGTTIAGYAITNLNLIYAPIGQNWEAAFGIYNLFDQEYMDPVALDAYMDPSVTREGITQDGRNWRLKFKYHFNF